MIHHIFTIFDQKAEAFLPPFFLPKKAMATRVFANCINDETHQFNKHPDDYTLFCIGTFDDNEASISPTIPQSLGNGVIFIKPDLADNDPDLFAENEHQAEHSAANGA